MRVAVLSLLVLFMLANAGETLAATALHARVVADPRTQARVVTEQSGTLEAPPGGFPEAGSRVRAGQVLAWLRPSIPEPERRDLDAQLAAARRDVKLGELQVRRFNVNTADQFDGQLPLPSLQILGEYRSAQVREAQLSAALQGRVALVAGADGVLIASRARSEQALDAGAAVFVIADAVAIELLSSDAGLDAATLSQAERASGTRVALHLLSSSFEPRLRARRYLFAPDDRAQALVVGESLRLLPGRAE